MLMSELQDLLGLVLCNHGNLFAKPILEWGDPRQIQTPRN